MSHIDNLTAFAAAPLVNTGVDGQYQATAIVKASYQWDERGRCASVEPLPIRPNDEYAGAPGQSGLLRAAEVGPPKAKVDVLLAGALAFPSPITEIDVELSLGNVLCKRARVFGERYWLPAVMADLTPSQPRPVTHVPIAWERCFAQDPKSLQGKPAPSFEDPNNLLPVRLLRPRPVGFGPVAAHWPERTCKAGTYDEAWRSSRWPLPPADFSLEYFNVATKDQQIEKYQPGEELRLFNMTTSVRDRICLPALDVPVTFVTSEELSEEIAVVDTIIVEPEARRLSLLARAQTDLPQGPLSLARIVIGEPTPGLRKAIESGKTYSSKLKKPRLL
jgi:hypothetical protein